jgi:hypothetical protein
MGALGTEGTQVPAPASLIDRSSATGLGRLVFTETSWAIVLCVLGTMSTFFPWFYLLGEPGAPSCNAYFTWPGIPIFFLLLGLGLLLAIRGFQKPVESWQPLALILTAVTLIVLTTLFRSTVESKLLASRPTTAWNSINNGVYGTGVYIELAISAGLLMLGFVQMRRRRGELATVRLLFDDEYFQHDAGRSGPGAEKRNVAWTEQPTHPMLGKLALCICLGGTVVALYIVGRERPFDRHALLIAFLWMVASQVVSLALGVVSRREALGRASAVASGILLLLSLVVVAIARG